MKNFFHTLTAVPFYIIIAMAVILFAGCASNAPSMRTGADNEEIVKIAADLFLEGKMAEVKKDWSSAISSYSEAFQYDPDSHEIAYSLAKAFLMDGKKRSALHYTKSAVRLNPEEAAYWQLLQYIEEQEKNFEGAAEALEMYLKLTPDHEINHEIKLAQYYFALDKDKKAVKMLLEQARDEHATAEEIANIASVLAYNGRTDDAISLFRGLIDRNPTNIQSYLMLAGMYEDIGRYEEAYRVYQDALEIEPDNVYLMVRIGNQCLMENDWNCSLKFFEAAYLAGPEKVEAEGINYIEIARTLASVYYYAGKEREGKAMVDSLRTSGYDDSRLYFSLGKTMNYLNRPREAIDYFKAGFEKEDVDDMTEESLYNAYLGYTRSLVSEDRAEDALDIIRNDAPEHLSNSVALKELEVSIYIKLNRFDDAISISEWLSDADPDNRAHLLRLSLVYDLAGQFENAEEALLKLLDLSPDDPLALNNLAYMYLENTKRISKAIDMVTKALDAEPENGAYLDTLGWAYYLKGNYKEALKTIEKALEVADVDDKGIIYEHYGDVLMKLGKKSEAVDAYNNAIEYGENEEGLRSKIQNAE